MSPKCNLYFQQGAQAALIAGMTPEDLAACNIYRIQHGTRSSGLGKGGKRSTRKKSRRGSKSKSKNRKSRKN
jgi:hypothetical protein